MIVDTDELKKFFLSLGYTEKNYEKIIKVPTIKKYNSEHLKEKVRDVRECLSEYYDNKSVNNITTWFPAIFSYNIDYIRGKITFFTSLGYTKEETLKMILNTPMIIGFSEENIKGKIEGLKSLGYKKDVVLRITARNSSVFLYTIDTIKESQEYFIKQLKYTKSELIKLLKVYPAIFNWSKDAVNEQIKVIMSLGYSREEAIGMLKKFPVLYTYSKDFLESRITEFMGYGYTREKFLKTVKRAPSIFGITSRNVEQKIETIKSFGYSREEAIGMMMESYTLYTLSNETIIDKRNFIISLGYSEDEVLRMAKAAPLIYSFSEINIRQKLEFYNSIGMHDYIVANPKDLIQSVALTYARYRFLTEEKQIDFSQTSFDALVTGSKKFEKRFGISNEALVLIYSYEQYIKEKNKEKDKGVQQLMVDNERLVEELEENVISDYGDSGRDALKN